MERNSEKNELSKEPIVPSASQRYGTPLLSPLPPYVGIPLRPDDRQPSQQVGEGEGIEERGATPLTCWVRWRSSGLWGRCPHSELHILFCNNHSCYVYVLHCNLSFFFQYWWLQPMDIAGTLPQGSKQRPNADNFQPSGYELSRHHLF